MGKLIDLTGKRFGRLFVIERDNDYQIKNKIKNPCWKCKCDCGKIVTIQGPALRSGHTKSCGCLQRERASQSSLKNLIGKRFGELEVIERDCSKSSGHQRKAYWLCKCTCGSVISVISDSLISGHTVSCGCINYSKGERKICEILKKCNLSFKQQFSFNDLLGNKAPLRFDFAIFNDSNQLQCLIEYQGQQHYKQVFFQSKEDFLNGLYNDKKKRDYCKYNNIKMIEIPYWDFNKINEEYILNLLKGGNND